MTSPAAPPRVGFLRPEATFTHIAARQRFGAEATYVPLETDAICRGVRRGQIDYGVLPIENLFEGTVGATLDAIYSTSDISVVAEIILPIHHHLLSRVSLDRIVRVYSHEQALSQCRNHLRRLEQELGWPLELVREASTARGAQRAAAEPSAAAIATEMAAEVYGLQVLRRNIEDGRDNATRFWVLGRGAAPPPTGSDKTSFLFEVDNEPGALATVLSKFAQRGLNATMIQSRPVRLDRPTGLWEYAFFVEFLGHLHDTAMTEVYRLLDKGHGVLCRRIRHLGSYPRAPLVE